MNWQRNDTQTSETTETSSQICKKVADVDNAGGTEDKGKMDANVRAFESES